MKKNKVVIFCAPKSVQEFYWQDESILLVDHKSWSHYDAEKNRRESIDIFDLPLNLRDSPSMQSVYSQLRGWYPVWSRWIPDAESYEMLYREAYIYVCHLSQGLLNYSIRAVVYFTATPQHLDTTLMKTACLVANVPSVFLYIDIVAGRLIPKIQRDRIEGRENLNKDISSFLSDDAINDFMANRKCGKAPVLNVQFSHLDRSYAFSIVEAAYLNSRLLLSNLKKKILAHSDTKSDTFFKQFPSIGFFGEIRLMRRQKKALKYFHEHVDSRPIEEVVASFDRTVIVLAAHFQPEATTFPEGGELSTHTDICIRLRQMGYTGPILYKEHSTSFAYRVPIVKHTRVGMYRSESYYRRLHELGCIFINPFLPIPLNSIKDTRFIPLTMTGTIAVERSLCGLPTIVTGFPWYKGMPGVIHLNSISTPIDNYLENIKDDVDAIKVNSIKFLRETLSRKTIVNVFGVGTGVQEKNSKLNDDFYLEFNCLLNHILSDNQFCLDR